MSEKYREYGYDVNSNELSKQVQEDIKEAKEIEKRVKELEAVLDDYAVSDNEYLVDGAILTCDRAKRGPIKVNLDGTVVEFEGNNASSFKYTRLNVIEREQRDNGLCAATIEDTVYGEEEGNNILPFRCNCSLPPDREWEIEKIKKNITYCKRYGTCGQLMNLNDMWENFPAEKAGFTHTGVDENESEKKERINMRSMLFCRHGGLITPVKSGQIMAQYDLKELRISGNHIALSNTTIQPSYSLTRYTQKKIQDLCEQNGVVYFDEDGYQRVGNTGLPSDPYLVAIAEYYQKAVIDESIGNSQGFGAIFKVTFSSEKEIFVTMGDLKAPADTQEAFINEGENFYAGVEKGANTLEFICNYNNHDPAFYSDNMVSTHGTDRNWGKAMTITEGSEIESIELLLGTEIEWEKYFPQDDEEASD